MNSPRLLSTTFLLGFLAAGATGCDAQSPATTQASAPASTQPAGAPTIDVVLAGRQFKLEVAKNDAERAQGLMFRKSMPVDHGMLFAFPDPQPRAFWMKNTLLPLDIAYLDANGVVINIEQMVPHDLSPVRSAGPAKFAIEINQGIAAKIGLKRGDRVQLPAIDAQ